MGLFLFDPEPARAASFSSGAFSFSKDRLEQAESVIVSPIHKAKQLFSMALYVIFLYITLIFIRCALCQ
jgi:hypothetical protein